MWYSLEPKKICEVQFPLQGQWRIQGGAPLRTKIFLISCSFFENPANFYVGAPPPGLALPPTGNPVSAPEGKC